MKKESMTFYDYDRNTGKYTEYDCGPITGNCTVYKALAAVLISYTEGNEYIKALVIEYKDGMKVVTVDYINDTREVYRVKAI